MRHGLRLGLSATLVNIESSYASSAVSPCIPLILIPYPLILLHGLRATCPIVGRQANAIPCLLELSPVRTFLHQISVRSEGNYSVYTRVRLYAYPFHSSPQPL